MAFFCPVFVFSLLAHATTNGTLLVMLSIVKCAFGRQSMDGTFFASGLVCLCAYRSFMAFGVSRFFAAETEHEKCKNHLIFNYHYHFVFVLHSLLVRSTCELKENRQKHISGARDIMPKQSSRMTD